MRVGTPKEQDPRGRDLNVIDVPKKRNTDERNGFTERQCPARIIVEGQQSVRDTVMTMDIFRNPKEALVTGKDATELKSCSTGFGDRTFTWTVGGDDGRRPPGESRHGLGGNFAYPDKKVLDRGLTRMSRCNLGKFVNEFLQARRNRASLAAIGKDGRDKAETDNKAGNDQSSDQKLS